MRASIRIVRVRRGMGLSKRRCGTCRFFQEASFANSGWCHHPVRRQTSDAMIMVRQNELACRNDWSRDYWMANDDVQESVPVVSDQQRYSTRQVDPASPDEIAAVVRGQQTNMNVKPPIHEDIVVGEGPMIPMRRESPEPAPSRTASDFDLELPEEVERATTTIDTRAAIFRAREQFRARSASTARADRGPLASDDRATTTNDPYCAHPTSAPPASDDALPAMAPVPVSEIRPGGRADDDDRFGTIPEPLPGFSLPRPATTANQPTIVGVDTTSDDRMMLPVDAIAPADPHQTAVTDRATNPADGDDEKQSGSSNGAPNHRWSDAETDIEADVRADALSAVDEDTFADHIPPRMSTPPSESSGTAEGRRSSRGLHRGRREASRARWQPIAPVPTNEIAQRDMPESVRASLIEPDTAFDDVPRLRDADIVVGPHGEVDEFTVEIERRDEDAFIAVAEMGDAAAIYSARIGDALVVGEIDDAMTYVDTVIRIAPGIPRMCRTCRDFRPAEGGDRGWCTNKWAFSHRRMVHLDELPCESPLGAWWLPADHVWMEQADISGHGLETPLMDHFMPGLKKVEETGRRRRS